MKTFLWTFALVAGGLWVYFKVTGKKLVTGTVTFGSLTISSPQATFEGPDIDPVTGANLNIGAQAGTVNFGSQPV